MWKSLGVNKKRLAPLRKQKVKGVSTATHGSSGKLSHGVKTDVKDNFLTFVDANRSPTTGRRIGRYLCGKVLPGCQVHKHPHTKQIRCAICGQGKSPGIVPEKMLHLAEMYDKFIEANRRLEILPAPERDRNPDDNAISAVGREVASADVARAHHKAVKRLKWAKKCPIQG